MKKVTVFILLLLFWSCSGSKENIPDPPLFECDECGDTERMMLMWSAWGFPGKPGVWDYPIKPGTDEWKQLTSNEEYLNASQIPEEVLKSLSTEDLTYLCLRNPWIFNLLYYSSVNFGFEKMFSELNCIRELYSRETEEIVSCLTARYMQIIQCLCLVEDKDFEGRIIFAQPMYVLEILLSRIELRENESNEILKEVLRTLVYGYEEKCKYPDRYGPNNLGCNFYARAYLISKICEQCLDSLGGIDTLDYNAHRGHITIEAIDLIHDLSYQLIN